MDFLIYHINKATKVSFPAKQNILSCLEFLYQIIFGLLCFMNAEQLMCLLNH